MESDECVGGFGLTRRMVRGQTLPMQRTLPRTRSCFVCGNANPIGLDLHFETDGQTVTAGFQPRPEHAGFKGTVHGGLLSTVLDEAMVWVCGVRTGKFAYCAELAVRFRQPARTGGVLRLEARLVEDRRGRVFQAEAELRDGTGQMIATANGKYMPIPDAALAGMLDDFVDDVRAVLRPASVPSDTRG
jgi:acyl-coenzyme A thioesterase PaaI-like protein